jgi:hypothetical protein
LQPVDRKALDLKRRDIDPLMATAPKHWVRCHVWLEIAKKRCQICNRPIRYFTLTTADLFDVKVLERAGLLEKTSRGYPGLGFCEMDDKTHEDIIRKLRWCDWSYKGLFEEMVFTYPRFESDFNFDVINLDFITVPFPKHEAPMEGTWGAIEKMIDVQWNHSISFDLFLTFRGSKDETDTDALKRVADLIKYNLDTGRGKSEFEAKIGHSDIDRLLKENYKEFLSTGIPKLLINRALTNGYMLTHFEAYSYQRQGHGIPYHIVKFVFSFEIPRSTGRVFGQPPPLVSNYDQAVPMIFSKQMFDISNYLSSESDLVDKLEHDLVSLKS